jgi:hypothetical protein
LKRVGLGERGEDVDHRGGRRGLPEALCLEGDVAHQRLEQEHLDLDRPLVGAQDLLFVFLELGRDEALAARDRLLAYVVGRDEAEVRLADLDVVPEDAVERTFSEEMPVRARSRSSMAAIVDRPPRLTSRSSSSSGSTPSGSRRPLSARGAARRPG